MSEWQPIESAPKDGLRILVAGGTAEASNSLAGRWKCDYVEIVYWDGDEWCGPNAGGHDEFVYHQPTAWKPLPAPPSPSSTRKASA